MAAEKRYHTEEPETGWYKIKLCTGYIRVPTAAAPGWRLKGLYEGPWVPAAVWWCEGKRDDDGELLEDEGFRCQIGPWQANAYRRWLGMAGHPLTQEEYTAMMTDAPWIPRPPEEPQVIHPTEAIDWATAPVGF